MMLINEPHLKESIVVDNFGRVTFISSKNFWRYVEKKRMTREQVMKLPAESRENFFMKWKHGMNDMNGNWEFEYTLRNFLKSFKDMKLEDVDPYFRDTLRMRRDFDAYCDEVKQSIGLWTGNKTTTKGLPKEVQDLVDKVGGTYIGEEVK